MAALLAIVIASALQISSAYQGVVFTRRIANNVHTSQLDSCAQRWKSGRAVPVLQLAMQERFPSVYRGGQQRRGRGRGGFNSGGGGSSSANRGDGGMSTDYVRGGIAAPTVDERLDRFVQNEISGGDRSAGFDTRAIHDRDRFRGGFTPRGLGRSKFFDDDMYPGKVQRGRVRAPTLPPLETLTSVGRC